VGKTSLLLRTTDGIFSENPKITIGVDYKKKKMKIAEQDVVLQLWDTAGEERFRTISSSWFRSVQAVALVYCVCDLDSFKDAESRFLPDFQSHAPLGCPMVLVGNMVDLEDKREVKEETGKELAKKLGCDFIETSAKTGSNVEELFMLLASKAAAFKPSHHHPSSVPRRRKQCILL